MIIGKELLASLSEKVKVNPRLRINYDLRNSDEDHSQRMLNAVEPGTVMPIHCHPTTSTTVIVIKGAIRQNFFDDHGKLEESVVLSGDGNIRCVQIEKGCYHNLESLTSGNVIFEAKDGSWEPYKLFEKNNKYEENISIRLYP